MINKIIITGMQQSDIFQALRIWQDQYELYCTGDKAYPGYWRKSTKEMEEFLKKKIEGKTAVAARLDNVLIGYMTFDEFPFNGEKSVFCPAVAHAAVEQYKEEAYLSLYKSISEDWANRNIFNHMWTINYNDYKLRNVLYDLGFGSYVIDAFACTSDIISGCCEYPVRKAELKDIDKLFHLVEESREYYRSAPLFLRRDQYSRKDLSEIVQNGGVFIAWDGSNAIGFINVSISQRHNIIELSVSNSGLIDEIGVYIKPEYRSKGLGKELLKNVFVYCSSNGIKGIHVDFETANLFANKFWRKYFKPMLLSVRRTVNKNIND